MNSIFDFSNVSDFVAFSLEERQMRNQNYSLGSFARDLGISKSILSGVITGKKGLRLVTLNKIIKAKKLNKVEEEYIKCIWTLNFSKSKMLRERAKGRIKVLRVHKGHVQMHQDQLNLLQEWYILPVIELICNGESEEKTALSLGIKLQVVTQTVQFLVDKNYLRKETRGKYTKRHDHIKFESQVSAEDIKNYHKRFSELSAKKLYSLPQKKRKFLTSILTVSPEDIDDARVELENFLSSFVLKYSNSAKAAEVCTLALQFYSLTEGHADDK